MNYSPWIKAGEGYWRLNEVEVPVSPGPPSWRLWGDGKEPLFEGSEEMAKAKYTSEYLNDDAVYLEDPDGNEFVHNRLSMEWEPV